MLCPFASSYWHFEGMLGQAPAARPWRWRHYDPSKYGNYSPIDVALNSHKTWLFNFNIVHTVHDTKFNLSNQSYMHWNVNMIHNLLYVLALLKCLSWLNSRGSSWGGTQKLLKHVGNCVSIVFTFQCTLGWFDKVNDSSVLSILRSHCVHLVSSKMDLQWLQQPNADNTACFFCCV
jgi:hypothetical protein